VDTAPPVPSPVDVLPPPDPRTVYRVGLIGLGLCAAAAVLGLVDDYALGGGPGFLSTVRLLLVGVGAVVAGAALSMRPGLWQAWAIAAGAALLAAVLGLPGHWDSARLLARVATGVAATGAVLTAAPANYRHAVVSFAALFHFGGILCATTWPDPTPWASNQMGTRVYLPYLTFLYMRNAYHFYSPDPGPASHLYALVKYELDDVDPATGKKKTTQEWVTMPRRDKHMRDPLGLSYYRRLSLAEMISGAAPGNTTANTVEKGQAEQRRAAATYGVGVPEPIPMAPPELVAIQYRVPYPHVSRYLLPSYAKHMAVELSGPGRRVTAVRLYRLEHQIIQPSALLGVTEKPNALGPLDPYHPSGYRPFYLGEYAPDGTLTDPEDPLLNWLVPIIPKYGQDPTENGYTDYLSKHAGYEVEWRRP
jgi:hypothetical protein